MLFGEVENGGKISKNRWRCAKLEIFVEFDGASSNLNVRQKLSKSGLYYRRNTTKTNRSHRDVWAKFRAPYLISRIIFNNLF